MANGKRVAIVQSNYVPWRGYFDLIASVDEFILLDDAQYTRRDWRNRNRIKTAQGARWLTIAVQVSGRYTQSIHETLVADPDWPIRHWDILRQEYRGAPGFDEVGPQVQELYATVPGPRLTDVNRHFLGRIAAFLGVTTPITLSLDYEPRGGKTERLLDLCLKAGATEYVSGPAARAYLEESRFEAQGIAVTWFEYGPYATYAQRHPPFDPNLSILDLMFCVGNAAPRAFNATLSG
ncbi:MAG: WbqC family protein, partial [Solirubrobacteraceae bacterium]